MKVAWRKRRTRKAGFRADQRTDHHRLFRVAAGVHHAALPDPRYAARAWTAFTVLPTASSATSTCGAPRCPARCRPRKTSRSPTTARPTSGMLKYVYRARAWPCATARPCSASPAFTTTFPAGKTRPLRSSRPKALSDTDRDFQSSAYIALIRNFRRYSWLLMYLFGASPALDAGFLRGRSHQLEQLRLDTLVPAVRHQPAHERPGLPEQRPSRA